jgi:hypothetical protein
MAQRAQRAHSVTVHSSAKAVGSLLGPRTPCSRCASSRVLCGLLPLCKGLALTESGCQSTEVINDRCHAFLMRCTSRVQSEEPVRWREHVRVGCQLPSSPAATRLPHVFTCSLHQLRSTHRCVRARTRGPALQIGRSSYAFHRLSWWPNLAQRASDSSLERRIVTCSESRCLLSRLPQRGARQRTVSSIGLHRLHYPRQSMQLRHHHDLL